MLQSKIYCLIVFIIIIMKLLSLLQHMFVCLFVCLYYIYLQLSGNSYVDQDDSELTESPLLLPPDFWD